MRYLSVCSGIEAATVAWHPLGWTPHAFSEIEPFPSAVLAHRYGSNLPGEPLTHSMFEGPPNYGDMTKFKEWPHAEIDLLVGGTPCQSFSVAGLRKGLDDPRGNLCLTYLAIADKYRPRWLVWENVPGVLSSGGGRDFGSFLGALAELGYGFAYRVLDAQYVRVDGHPRAVPQRRRRVFVVGYLGDWRRAAAVLFERESMHGDTPPRRQAGQRIAPTISSRPTGGGGLGTDFDLDGGLVARSLNAHAHANRCDGETETFVAHYQDSEFGCKEYDTGAIRAGRIPEHSMVVTHALRAEGFDASDHFDRDGGLVATDLRNGALDEVAMSLQSGGMGEDRGLCINAIPHVLTATSNSVAHTLRGAGFDAGEDGTGRGTPLIPINFQTRGSNIDLEQGLAATLGSNADRASGSAPCVAFSCKDYGADAQDDIAPTMRAMGHAGSHANAGGQLAIAIQERAVCENPNAGPDGIGVRTDGAAYTVEARQVPQAVAFDMRGREGGAIPISADADRANSSALTPSPDAEGRVRLRDPGLGIGEDGDPMFTLQATKPHAVAFDMRGREGGAQFEGPHETANIRAASGGSSKSYVAFAENSRAELRLCGGDGQVSSQLTTGGGKPGQGRPCVAETWAVRRLMPVECERLQGFPDGYTDVPYRRKPAADGPRYKALGNSMAVNVMRWIGRRIEMVENLEKATTQQRGET